MTLVGRSKLDHPSLGTSGGSILHGQIETIYQTISDHLGARFKAYASQANSTTVTYEHGFGVAYSELTVLLYTGTHPNLTRVSDPAASGWTIVATPASLTTSINITAPATGGPHTFAVFVVQGRTITPLSITNADIAASAAIADSKLSISASTVTGKALTGYTIAGSASALATTDTVLGAFGKLEASVNAKEPAFNSLPDSKLATISTPSKVNCSALTGTIPTGVLGNSSAFIGTTSVALNRASANQGLTGISSIAMPGATSGTVTLTPAATAGTTAITVPATSGTVVVKDTNGNFTAGTITADLTGNCSGTASNVTGIVAIANGGTGNSTASGAINALVPAQSGNSGKVLSTNGTAVSWQSALTNPMTTDADMIVGGASGGPSRLAKGTANQVLGMNSGATAQEYKSFAVGATGSDFAIAHTANTVTLNLPDASATARGVVSTGNQTFAGIKSFSSNPCVIATRATSNQSISDGNFATVIFNNEVLDRNSNYDPSFGIFTVPTGGAGIYQISVGVGTTNSTCTRVQLTVTTTSGSYIVYDSPTGITQTRGGSGSITISLAVADQVYIRAYLTGTSPVVDFGATTYLTIYKVG